MDVRYPLLFPRDDGVADQCVSCPDTLPTCNCKPGENCRQITRTCEKCAYIECSSSGLSKNVGGIAGGIVGGVIFIALVVGYLVWARKRHHKLNRLLRMEAQDKELLEVIDGEYRDEDGQKPIRMKTLGESELNLAVSLPGGQLLHFARLRALRVLQMTFLLMASLALSRALNIIPIAYIPGVKIRSNLTLLNNRQIVDDVQSIDLRKPTTYGSPLSTVTAVRAIPKLVDVGRKATAPLSQEVIYENDNDSESDIGSLTSSEGYRRNNPSLKLLSEREQQEKKRKSVPGLTHIVEENDADELISLGTDSEDDEQIYNIRGNTPQLAKYTSKGRPSNAVDVPGKGNPLNPFDDVFEEEKI